jgi:hypothetical protein
MHPLLASVRSILVSTPGRWASLIEIYPPELLTQPPAPGEWSALDCLQHIIDSEPVFQLRVDLFLEGRDYFPNFDPDTQGTKTGGRSPAAVVDEFTRLRALGLAALSRITPPDLPRRAIHQELGPVTLEEMLHNWGGHDLMHTVQAERALLQPFIRGCGPWQRYYTDHAVLVK